MADRHIQNLKARDVWLRAKGMETVPYHNLFEQLEMEFFEFTGSRRKLVHKDLMEPCRLHGMKNDLTFPIISFDSFYAWFDGLCLLVKVLNNVWNEDNPILIHFFTRNDCEQKLQNAIPGTFIIRFSTAPKSIAISYREHRMNHRVTHLKASLTADSRFQFDLRSEHHLRYMLLVVFALFFAFVFN